MVTSGEAAIRERTTSGMDLSTCPMYEKPVLLLVALHDQLHTDSSGEVVRATRVTSAEFHETSLEEYFWYPLSGQHNVAAARRCLHEHPAVAKELRLDTWTARPVYYPDQFMDHYGTLSTFQNAKDKWNTSPHQSSVVRDIRKLWKASACPDAKGGQGAEEKNAGYRKFAGEALRVTGVNHYVDMSLGPWSSVWPDVLGPYMILARASEDVYDSVMNVYAVWERSQLPERDAVKPATKQGEAGKAQKLDTRMVVIMYSNDGDYHRNTIPLFEDIQPAEPSSSSRATDTLTLARRERKPKLLMDVIEKNFQPTKWKSAGLEPKEKVVYEGMERELNSMVETVEHFCPADKVVMFLGKGHPALVWELLKSHRHNIVLEGEDMKFDFLVQFVKQMVGVRDYHAKFIKPPPRHDEARDFVYKFDADDSEEESVDGTLQVVLASERQKVTPSSSQKMATAGTSSGTPSIGTSGVAVAGAMTLPLVTPPAGTAALGVSSSAGLMSDPAAVFRALFGAEASPELISSFQGLVQSPALLQRLLSQPTQAAPAKELEYEYEIGDTIPADIAQLTGPIVCQDDHTVMEADKWSHDIVWHPGHFQPALAKGKWVMAIKEDRQWQFCSHRRMPQSRFYTHAKNQIRMRLARLNLNVSASRVDIRTKEVFQELKALRRLEYLKIFYDRQTSPTFGYNWRIDEGNEGDETGGKRGQGRGGGASGEGGEHPSGDEGGGDEGGRDKGGSGEGGGTSEAPRYSQPTTDTSEGQAHRHHEGSGNGVGGHIDIRGLPQVKLSTAVEQVDEGCEGGQSVTTTLTSATVTDIERCDASGASVFPVAEKANIGSPQGHMWMSMDILSYGLGSQGRLRASLDETMYLEETELQVEPRTPLDEETLRGDLEIPTEFRSPISAETAQRGSQEARTVTGYQEEAMFAPGGEPNSPFDEETPGGDFETRIGGSQDSPIVSVTAGTNDTLEGLVGKEAIRVPDIEEDEGHIVLTTPEQHTPVEEGQESTLQTPVQQFSPSVKVINIEESPLTSRQFRGAKEDCAQGKIAVSCRGLRKGLWKAPRVHSQRNSDNNIIRRGLQALSTLPLLPKTAKRRAEPVTIPFVKPPALRMFKAVGIGTKQGKKLHREVCIVCVVESGSDSEVGKQAPS
ncbi:hypothetical protein CBR_g50770 [Chara braunii]|uniref:Uncharacterized protein n=1 Tax=Chara braunii TaxID=69332 RepID=A0A388K5V8_CHABU|nr:hypothetical protein CBR_g50770 [Chara braunii]|eukprot:GBG65409.1 hypothetical protein CBR_g50770 [Chara braunii]